MFVPDRRDGVYESALLYADVQGTCTRWLLGLSYVKMCLCLIDVCSCLLGLLYVNCLYLTAEATCTNQHYCMQLLDLP